MLRMIMGSIFMGLLFSLSTGNVYSHPSPSLPPVDTTRERDIASYNIKAELLPAEKKVQGQLELTWKNTSSDAVGELWFHLYMNAFRNNRSTFFHEWAKGMGFSDTPHPLQPDQWGWIDIAKMQVVQGEDLTKAIEFVQPDDGNTEDRTVIRVRLQKSVLPGQSIRLLIQFTTRLPWAIARTGYRDTFFMVAQWYPKIGVYEKTGMRGATKGRWNCHQYHVSTEYYANFGTYRAELTVPSSYVVGATGKQIRLQHHPQHNKTTYTFMQKDVHDFAWTAYPGFKRFVRTFRAKQDVSPKQTQEVASLLGLPTSALVLRDVEMIFLLPPERVPQLEKYIKATRESLIFYGLHYGAYPYDTVTVVDVPWEGKVRGASGMEYPTLFTVGGRWLHAPRVLSFEFTLIHEFGHQYFQGMIASNEFEEAWLDEGINTYTNILMMRQTYADLLSAPRILHIPWVSFAFTLSMEDFLRWGYLMGVGKRDKISRPGWTFLRAQEYGALTYAKTAIVFLTLERILGKSVMARAMRTYFQRWQFRHPRGQDLIQVLEEVSKRDLRSFFDQFLHGTSSLDYAVESIRSQKMPRPQGRFEQKPTHRSAPQKATTPQPSTVPVLRSSSQAKQREKQPLSSKHEKYWNIVVIRRLGEAIWPVDIKITFTDKTVMNKVWDGKDRWIRYEIWHPSKVACVEVDPERKLLLDTNFLNNCLCQTKTSKTPLRWTSRLVFWLQNIFHSLTTISW